MLQLIFGVAMVSFSAVFVKLVTVEPTAAAFWRMFLGGLVLAGITLARREKLWFGTRAMLPAGIAAFWFMLDLVFWHRSILFVGPGLATLLANFQVFLLALAGVIMFRERPGWRLGAGVLLAFAGLGLLVAPEWFTLGRNYQLGVVFGLITAVCYAAYILTLRASRVADLAPSIYANMAVLSLSCALLLGLVALAQGESLAITRPADAGWLLTYGIVAQLLGWLVISKSLPTMRTSAVGLILLLQPTLAFAWDALFFDRRFTLIQIVGAVLTLGAIYLGSLKRGVRSKSEEQGVRSKE